MYKLGTYGFISESTLHRLCYPTIRHGNNAQTRLKKLVDHGYIGRRFLPIRRQLDPEVEFFDYGGQPYHYGAVYYLKRRGADYLHVKFGMPGTQLSVRQDHQQVKLYFLSHDLDVSDVHACLDLAVRIHPAIQLGRWINEKDRADGDFILRMPVELRDREDGTPRRCSLWPDAAFLLKEMRTGREALLFLEIDEGNEVIDRKIHDKMLGYRAYGESGVTDELFEFEGSGFCVLMVSRGRRGEGRGRIRNLMDKAREVGVEDRFGFTTFTALMPEGMVTGDRVLTQALWCRGEGERPFSLVEWLFGP
jgi:hypothetical protein